MESNPIRVCELLVGPPDVNVLGVEDDDPVQPLQVHVEIRGSRPRCVGCGSEARVKDRPPVMLVDLPAFGRPVRLVWRKHRWQCPDPVCGVGSWTGEDARIGYARLALTDRAGRWVTQQVGRHGRTVNEVASELDCDWHTVNDAVIAYGTVLVDDPDRIGEVTALGLDETLFSREGPWNRQSWSTSIVDVTAGRLLDVVPGRTAVESSKWLEARGPEWRSNIRLGHIGSVRPISGDLRHDASRRRPGGRPDPCGPSRQLQTRRMPASSPERDARAPRPQGRSAVIASAAC